MTVCNNCGGKVTLEITSLINHSGSKYSGGNGSYKLMIRAKCDCETEKPMATDLTGIEFSGDPPEGWG